MSLADEARALTHKSGLPCGVAALPPELQAEVREAVEQRIPASAIARAVQARGHRLSGYTLGRHVRGDCSCH